LRVAKTVLEGTKNSLAVTVLHLTPGTDTNPIHGELFAVESFKGVETEAQSQRIPIDTMYKVTDNIETEIVKTSNYNNFDFLLVGAGATLSGIPFLKESTLFKRFTLLNTIINNISQKQIYFYPGSMLKDKTRYFIEHANCSVGVFVNRGFKGITSTIVLLQNDSDEFLLRYARRILKNNSETNIHILDVSKITESNKQISNTVNLLREQFPESVKLTKTTRIQSVVMSKFSFMLISYNSWNHFTESDKKELSNIPSTLIINKKISRFHTGARNKIVYNDTIEDVSVAF